jgi:hypothetical protein
MANKTSSKQQAKTGHNFVESSGVLAQKFKEMLDKTKNHFNTEAKLKI